MPSQHGDNPSELSGSQSSALVLGTFENRCSLMSWRTIYLYAGHEDKVTDFYRLIIHPAPLVWGNLWPRVRDDRMLDRWMLCDPSKTP